MSNRQLIYTILFLGLSYNSLSQQHMNIEGFQPELNYDNVHTYQLDSDSNLTSTLIWIKESVPEHYHKNHSEIVYVLEGSAEVQLDDMIKTVKSGDYLFIPAGTKHKVTVKNEETLKVLSIKSPLFDGSDRVFTDEY
jgi:quercetin dioxygenase-like cupin family protein